MVKSHGEMSWTYWLALGSGLVSMIAWRYFDLSAWLRFLNSQMPGYLYLSSSLHAPRICCQFQFDNCELEEVQIAYHSESCRESDAAPADDQTRSCCGRSTPGASYSSTRPALLARGAHPFEQAYATVPWHRNWQGHLIHELLKPPSRVWSLCSPRSFSRKLDYWHSPLDNPWPSFLWLLRTSSCLSTRQPFVY